MFDAVERHRRDQRLADDLTVLVLSPGRSPAGTSCRTDRDSGSLSSPDRRLDCGAGIWIRRPIDEPGSSGPDPDWTMCCKALAPRPRALSTPAFAGQAPVRPVDDEDLSIQAFLQAVEAADLDHGSARWIELLSANADRDQAARVLSMRWCPQGVTRAVVKERDRAPLAGTLPGEGYRLIVEVFIETGAARAHRHLAPRHPPAARRRPRAAAVARSSPKIAWRRSRACIVWRSTPSSSSRRATSSLQLGRFRAAAAGRRCVRGRRRRRA